MTEFNGPDPEYDRALAADVIYPGGIRVSDPVHKSLQLQEAHAQSGEVPAATAAMLTPEPEPESEDDEPTPKKKKK